MITQTYLKQIFDYCDGNLIWKVKPAARVKIGDKVGSLNAQGRLCTRIKSKSYLIHRLIFMWHHGFLPEFIDHIDNNPLNNRIKNLRCATRKQNNQNAKMPVTNTSGVKNVFLHKETQRWQVLISGKYFGLYKDKELAELVAMEARDKLHKEFARHI
jgi:hypothetical protein